MDLLRHLTYYTALHIFDVLPMCYPCLRQRVSMVHHFLPHLHHLSPLHDFMMQITRSFTQHHVSGFIAA